VNRSIAIVDGTCSTISTHRSRYSSTENDEHPDYAVLLIGEDEFRV